MAYVDTGIILEKLADLPDFDEVAERLLLHRRSYNVKMEQLGSGSWFERAGSLDRWIRTDMVYKKPPDNNTFLCVNIGTGKTAEIAADEMVRSVKLV